VDVVYATATGRVGVGEAGGGGVVRKGTHWPADDPVVRQHPDMFSADPRYGLQFSEEPPGYRDGLPGEAPVEQATAGPGERRNSRKGEARG
jgi:hypothetical protein